jgi:hypothetical protein
LSEIIAPPELPRGDGPPDRPPTQLPDRPAVRPQDDKLLANQAYAEQLRAQLAARAPKTKTIHGRLDLLFLRPGPRPNLSPQMVGPSNESLASTVEIGPSGELRSRPAKLPSEPTVVPVPDHPGSLNVTVTECLLNDPALLAKLAADEAAVLEGADEAVQAVVTTLANGPEAKSVLKAAQEAVAADDVLAKAQAEQAGHVAKADAVYESGKGDPGPFELAAKFAAVKVRRAQAVVSEANGRLQAAKALYRVAFIQGYAAEVMALVEKNTREVDQAEQSLVVALARNAVKLEALKAAGDRLNRALGAYEDKRWGGAYDPNRMTRAEAIKNGWITPGLPVPDPVQ